MSLIQRATAAVFGDPIDAPEEVPPDSVPQGVRFRRGSLVPWIGGLLARSRHPASAVTLGRTIILNPSARLTSHLLAHELAHVRQWKADPLFPLRYTLATLRHGYHDNPYEVEAREAARAATGRSEAPPTSPP